MDMLEWFIYGNIKNLFSGLKEGIWMHNKRVMDFQKRKTTPCKGSSKKNTNY